MKRERRSAGSALRLFLLAALPLGCGGGERGSGDSRTLTLGAYTTPREAYGQKIIPAFRAHWRAKTGESVDVEESYLGSSAQARAVREGFEADVAALSLAPDVQILVDAGLVKPDWNAGPGGGMVTRSVVVIGVRPGNPKGIRDWSDLARPDVEVLTANPNTSGGAMWNIAALYGAAAVAGGTQAAERLLGAVLSRVRVMDRGARESMITFESGVGDAIITYENEVIVARRAGKRIDSVIPTATILIENPVVVVDTYVDEHGSRDVAEEFVRFLRAPVAQRIFADYGLRPVDPTVAGERADAFPAVPGLFTIADLGGWDTVTRTLFADGAAFDRLVDRGRVAR